MKCYYMIPTVLWKEALKSLFHQQLRRSPFEVPYHSMLPWKEIFSLLQFSKNVQYLNSMFVLTEIMISLSFPFLL